MNDELLLRLAAKAAGIEVEFLLQADGSQTSVAKYEAFDVDGCLWNPLINDGDAFKLAIDLGMQVNVEGSGENEAVWADDTMVWVNSKYAQGDRRKAARSAIVSVAAQRGEQMP